MGSQSVGHNWVTVLNWTENTALWSMISLMYKNSSSPGILSYFITSVISLSYDALSNFYAFYSAKVLSMKDLFIYRWRLWSTHIISSELVNLKLQSEHIINYRDSLPTVHVQYLLVMESWSSELGFACIFALCKKGTIKLQLHIIGKGVQKWHSVR